jgi:Rrf2 family protein
MGDEMFSQTVEYALRAMTQLAVDVPGGYTTQFIAKKTDVPAAYLAKVLQGMKRAGLITSRRGVGGGVKLARPAKKISLLDVVSAVESLNRRVETPKGASAAGLGRLNQKMNAITAQVQKGLASSTLADVAPRSAR